MKRLVERVREERTVRTLEEFEERNEHRFDNTGGDNRTGIYRWLDKWYRAKVVDYGKRLFYEFVVPEPAAFYIFARTYNFESRPLPPEPVVPKNIDEDGEETTEVLEPEHINRDNYLLLAGLNEAQGIAPPPPEDIYLARTVARELRPEQPFALVNNEIELPDGYVLDKASWGAAIWVTDVEDFRLDVSVGRKWTQYRPDPDDPQGMSIESNDYPLPPLTGMIPVSLLGHGIASVSVRLHFRGTLTSEAFQKWQLQIFDAVMNAYRSKVVDFEEKLAASQVEGGVRISGNNPLINRQIEREELKKSCITLWTGFRYNGVPGITQDEQAEGPPGNHPEIHIENSLELTPEIQFLEQSFDWKNMTYEFLPYYWGRKKNWADILALEDPDPLFNDFLHAGAARVLVPVQRAATESVLYFQLTGALWPGGDVPFFTPPDPSDTLAGNVPGAADDPDDELSLYNAYLAELRRDGDSVSDDIDKEIEIDADDPETWLYRVPTTLVMLQTDATLPDLEPE